MKKLYAAAVITAAAACLAACAGIPAKQSVPDIPMAAETGQAGEQKDGQKGNQKENQAEESPSKACVYSVDEAVAAAILEHNENNYLPGEAAGEGHWILDSEDMENGCKVYVQAMYGTYRFENGNFVKAGGSGANPAVIVLRKDENGAYDCEQYQEPMDGGDFIESIHNMFPEHLWEECTVYDAQRVRELTKQEQKYAADYLSSIGREAEIGNFGDFDYTSLTDVGISVEVSNALLDRSRFDSDSPAACAPDWIGTVERLEDGVRYIYECSYDQNRNEIIYAKKRYDTGEVIDQAIYDGETAKKKDILLTFAPEIRLQDALSSTFDQFTVLPGNCSWNYLEGEEMVGLVACGSHPLEAAAEIQEPLKVPEYNRLDEVTYLVSCVIPPKKLTVREWDISQTGDGNVEENAKTIDTDTIHTEPIYTENTYTETIYTDTMYISLKRDKVYEIVADWPEEDFNANRFFGQASYVVVTGKK